MKLIIGLFIALLVLKTSYGAEDSPYKFNWLDPDKRVYVLQNKQIRKAKNVNVAIGGGITTSGAFTDAKNFQGRVGYFFTEQWGVEVLYSINSWSENSTAKSVRSTGAVAFRRAVTNYYLLNAIWVPFYGKLNFADKIFYFDWSVGLGVGKAKEENNRGDVELGVDTGVLSKENHTAYNFSTGFRFYFLHNWAIRLDLTGLIYSARSGVKNQTKSNNYNNIDLTLSLGYTF